MSKVFQIRFSIIFQDKIYSEEMIGVDIVPNISNYKRKGKFNLSVMDGFLSLRFNDKELMGEEFMEEMKWFFPELMFHLASLVRNNSSIEIFLPLNSCYMRMSSNFGFINYQLSSITPNRVVDIKASIPEADFIRELFFAHIRFTRFLSFLGDTTNAIAEKNWFGFVEGEFSKFISFEEIKLLVEEPIDNLLLKSDCA